MARAISRKVISDRKKSKFLEILSITGRVTEAARAVGYTHTAYLHKCRQDDEDFAEGWALALNAAANVLEEEAIRRATDGVLDPVFYKGEIVGHKVNYSDSLLMFILRGLKPDVYRDSNRGGEVSMNFGIAVLPMTATNDDAWEKTAISMHDKQKPIVLEAKPVENNMDRSAKTVKRGD